MFSVRDEHSRPYAMLRLRTSTAEGYGRALGAHEPPELWIIDLWSGGRNPKELTNEGDRTCDYSRHVVPVVESIECRKLQPKGRRLRRATELTLHVQNIVDRCSSCRVHYSQKYILSLNHCQQSW